ncbi:hypothetical protein [Clostridium chromiireducens]|uniref:Uncharacterized protein n=1 Tax=Clostridium chromiireducens TaxID=225345 RepID=A0A1V4IIL7_9CLOT|nr:hypothetical protein [Clostridium chromiireducens]OPJ59690.1 hypothetical protein CLCHR_33680 [Clostridium chromiireducens]
MTNSNTENGTDVITNTGRFLSLMSIMEFYGKFNSQLQLLIGAPPQKIWYITSYVNIVLLAIKAYKLNDYLDIQALDKGYLIVYNFNKDKDYKEEIIHYEGKEIFIVFV